jgi:hypothetical protein
MYFIRDYLYKLGSDIEREEIKALVRQATSSRFAIMTPEKVTLIGDYNTEDGIFYSNYSYYNYKSYVGTSTSTTGKKKKGKHTTAISPAYGVYVNDNYNADIDDLNGVDIDDDYYIIDICLRATDSGKKLKKAIEETWDELEKLSCYPLAYIDKQADSDGIVTFEVRRLPKMVLDGDMDKIAGRWWYSLGKNSEV